MLQWLLCSSKMVTKSEARGYPRREKVGGVHLVLIYKYIPELRYVPGVVLTK